MSSSLFPRRSILIINPNSTSSMTDALKPLVDSLGYQDTSYTYFTAPEHSPASINSISDCQASSAASIPSLTPLLGTHHAFLIACYSPHPLVAALKSQPSILSANKPVTGIFEASVLAALGLLGPGESFGIVSTAAQWEGILSAAVGELLGSPQATSLASATQEPASALSISTRFAGVETTGLNATELHDAPQSEVRRRMVEATRRLVRRGDVGAICLGCAGMSGMSEWVMEGCMEELGQEKGRRVRVVDGVAAGVAMLEGWLRVGS